ncbi:MAG: hypothetical protein AAGC93_08060 [Cyanobacteria bacterium P01_F01_bin.53]
MRLKTGLIAGGAALSLPLIIGVYQVWPRSEGDGWQPATEVAPPGLMTKIAADNLAPEFEGELGHMKIMRPWQPGQTTPIYLIDSRIADLSTQNNPLCGALGCAFFGYVPLEDEGFQSVLSLYLDPHLPPEISLIETGDTLQNNMPALIIHQLEDEQLLRMRLGLNDGRYEVVEAQYLPMDTDD